MEVYGEHASAFMDHLAAQGRIKASATQQTNKKKRDAIIIGQITDVVDDEKQPPALLHGIASAGSRPHSMQEISTR
jgi:hypothetical protein